MMCPVSYSPRRTKARRARRQEWRSANYARLTPAAKAAVSPAEMHALVAAGLENIKGCGFARCSVSAYDGFSDATLHRLAERGLLEHAPYPSEYWNLTDLGYRWSARLRSLLELPVYPRLEDKESR